VAALLEHRSQHRATMGIGPDDDGAGLAAFRARILGRLAEHGREVGVGEAELFRALRDL